MVHLSEVLGLTVFDADKQRVGKLDDMYCDPITGLMRFVRVKRNRETLMFSWSSVEVLSPELRKAELVPAARPLPSEEMAGEFIGLKRDVLDRVAELGGGGGVGEGPGRAKIGDAQRALQGERAAHQLAVDGVEAAVG